MEKTRTTYMNNNFLLMLSYHTYVHHDRLSEIKNTVHRCSYKYVQFKHVCTIEVLSTKVNITDYTYNISCNFKICVVITK